MKKTVKVKAPAKINLTLDILGEEGGYHQLKSLVTTIGIKDTITIKKRKDKQKKRPSVCGYLFHDTPLEKHTRKGNFSFLIYYRSLL